MAPPVLVINPFIDVDGVLRLLHPALAAIVVVVLVAVLVLVVEVGLHLLVVAFSKLDYFVLQVVA